MSQPKQFHYSPVTGELLGDTVTQVSAGIEGPIVQAFATLKAPGRAPDGFTMCFLTADGDVPMVEEDGEWQPVLDNRGKSYWTQDGKQHDIFELGVDFPPGALHLPPPRRIEDVKADAMQRIQAAYTAASQASVSYTSVGGVTQLYQADVARSVQNLNGQLGAYQATQATPDGYYWVAEDNTRVPFTYADLQGLYAAIGAAAFHAFDVWQDLKAALRDATTAEEVNAIAWPSPAPQQGSGSPQI